MENTLCELRSGGKKQAAWSGDAIRTTRPAAYSNSF
jgi:hypothetical protein